MEQLVNFIIRPPRAEYSPEHDLLDQEFMLKGRWYQRKDIEIKNRREDILKCSHYMPTVCPEGKTLPCVIYCHGNSGCRADASEAAIMLLPLNITVFTLDFSGSGLSGGEHVTLGWNEKDDLKAVVDYLREDGNVSMIGLWGRSMGAVTSLMYGAEDPSIAGMVLDSPFSDLVDLMMELVDTYKIRLPKFTVKFAIQYMRRAVQKKAKFDISDLNTIKVAKSCFVPVLFGHAIDDDFIQPHHSERIHDVYMGDKNIIKFDGDHNSPRPQFYFDSISIFFKNVLQPPDDDRGGAVYDSVHMHDYIDKATWTALQGIGFRPSNISVTAKGTEAGSSTTGDTIEQLRSKRPMSRVEVPADISTGEEHQETKEDITTSGSPSSSSGMISFELSNGHPCDPNVPASLDDDQYVEYPLDYSTDFPCDMEDEERMLMLAVMESLKDLDSKPHNPDVKDISGSNSTESTTQKSETGTIPTNERCDSATLDTTMDMTSSLTLSGNIVHIKGGTSQESSNGLNLNPDPLKTDDKSSDTGPTGSDDCSSDGTKATLTVEKAPSANIMDGFFRRLDRNFFKK